MIYLSSSVYRCFACTSICAPHVRGIRRKQLAPWNRSYTLGVRHMWGAESWIQVSCESLVHSSALFTAESPLQVPPFKYKWFGSELNHIKNRGAETEGSIGFRSPERRGHSARAQWWHGDESVTQIPGEERGDQKHNSSVERTVGVQDRKGERTELRKAEDEEIRHNRTNVPGWLREGRL